MMDERIKKLKYSKEYLATHIANKKKRIKKVVAGDKLDRGTEKREKILQSLAASESFSDTDDDTSLHQEDLPKIVRKRTNEELGEELDEIKSRRFNEKRGRWEWEIGDNENTSWEPKESLLDDHGNEMEILKDFENSNPYEDEQPEGNVLTQGSRYVFNHTRKLASAQVRTEIIPIVK